MSVPELQLETPKLSGDSTAAILVRNHEIQSRPGGPLTVPAPAREPARRGRPDPSPRSGTSRFSGAPGSASDLPGGRPASQPRPHPAPQRGAAPAPHRRVLPAPPQPPELSKPLVFVFSLRRPQGAGRVTPRGGILSLPQWSWKRVPAAGLRARPLLAASVPLSLAEPGSAVESGTWISVSRRDGFGRGPR